MYLCLIMLPLDEEEQHYGQRSRFFNLLLIKNKSNNDRGIALERLSTQSI